MQHPAVKPHGALTVWLVEGVVYFRDTGFRGAFKGYVQRELLGMRSAGQPPPDAEMVALIDQMLAAESWVKGRPPVTVII